MSCYDSDINKYCVGQQVQCVLTFSIMAITTVVMVKTDNEYGSGLVKVPLKALIKVRERSWLQCNKV